MDVIDVRELVDMLNMYREAYYINNESLISDKEYDELFDKLVAAEKETGVVFPDSPTVTVGYQVMSELNEVVHDYPPMLSLDKSKNIEDMIKFIGDRFGLVMAKLDGLTCRLTYEEGKLVRAETRGDGFSGEDVTHNVQVITNVPLTIPAQGTVVVDGEVICTLPNFEKIKNKYTDAKGKTYKNARNFASGSVRLLDSAKSAKRNLTFVAWKFTSGSEDPSFMSRFMKLSELGFTVVPFYALDNTSNYSDVVADIIDKCDEYGYPIDGCVFSYDNVAYMEQLGYTSHHSRAQIAYKFYDEMYETRIRDIDWTMGKTGALTPTAVFDTVEIDGTGVSRASLHNITIMKQLNVRKDCTARVFKANMIIPQVKEVDNDGTEDFVIPYVCPICGGNTIVTKDNESEVLICTNSNCQGKLLGKLCTFVSKQGMDIDGLGENNLAKFIELGLISSFTDIYHLCEHRTFLKTLEGRGEASVEKLLTSIEVSKNVNIENFIAALSIPNVGLTTAKTICKYFDNDITKLMSAVKCDFDFSDVENIGDKTAQVINRWFRENEELVEQLLATIHVRETVTKTVKRDSPISGKTFCITGTFTCGKREALKTQLEKLGGTSVDGVSMKTDILFVGDKAGSKLKKAQELNIIIYDEAKLVELLEATSAKD